MLGITELIASLVSPVTALIGKVIPDKDKAAKLAHDITTMVTTNIHLQIMGQIDINKVEAAHKNLFVAGWRPFIGWTCGVAMFNNYLLASWFDFIVPMELAVMMPVLMGMLGLGGMRSFEKIKGVAREK